MSTASELREQAEAIAAEAPKVEARHPSLAAALVAALADLTVVEAGRTAKIEMKGGGNYSYKYGDLADVVRLTRPVLGRHGLVALTPVHDHGPGLACTVKLVHESGDVLDLGPFPFPAGRDAQATGSAVTYHRRYSLLAALGMAVGDEDDDGAKATTAAREPVWTKADAKNRMLAATSADLAPAAWVHFQGDDRWRDWEHQFPQAEVDAWLNEDPASPVEEPGEGTA